MEGVLFGPSPEDWPFSPGTPPARGERPTAVPPVRHGLALASYLEKQDANRWASKPSAATAIGRLLPRVFAKGLRLLSNTRFAKATRVAE